MQEHQENKGNSKIELEVDVANLFIWLYDSERLQGHRFSQFYVRSLVILTFLVQALFSYEIVIGIDLYSVLLTHLNLNSNGASVKEINCGNSLTGSCAGSLVVLMMVTKLE